MLMSETSKILLHRVTRHRQNSWRRQTQRNLSSVFFFFVLRVCVLTMATMPWTAPARHRVKQTTGASNVSQASTSLVSTDTDVLRKHEELPHIFSPLFLQGKRTSYSKYFSMDKQSGTDKRLLRSFPHSFQGTDPPSLESFRSTSRMDLERKT